MADHVRDQIAAPEIEPGQNSAQDEGDKDVGPAPGPVAERKDDKRNGGRPITIDPDGLEASMA